MVLGYFIFRFRSWNGFMSFFVRPPYMLGAQPLVFYNLKIKVIKINKYISYLNIIIEKHKP